MLPVEYTLQLPRYKQEWRNICAILPVYLADGTNGTAITYTDGSVEEVPNRLYWVLDDLLGYLKSSKSILTKQSRTVLGDKARCVPLALSPDFCLMLVKGREGIGKYDKNAGYIVQRHVDKLVSAGNGTRVIFNSGAEVQVKNKPRTVWENLQKTEALKQKLCA